MQRIRRGRDQERKDLHKSIRCCDSAEDQHNFPDGPFRPLPEILQTLNYGGTWCGCHGVTPGRSEEHTSELQSLRHLVCRLLLEKKKNKRNIWRTQTKRLSKDHVDMKIHSPDT